MIMEILLNPKTHASITKIIYAPQQTVGINASVGSGKATIAKYIADKILTHHGSVQSYISVHQPIDNKYTIEQTRQIISNINLKPHKANTIAQIIILEDFDLMTSQVQNLFLKPIEDPTAGVMFILTYSDKQKVLPTILSRIKVLSIENIASSSVIDYFIDSYDEKAIKTAYNIANGKIGLINSILQNNQEPLLEEIEMSKTFLISDKYNKLIITNKIAKKDIGLFLEAIAIVADSGMKNALDKNVNQLKKWHLIRKNILFAKSLYATNGNTKLILTYLSINIV